MGRALVLISGIDCTVWRDIHVSGAELVVGWLEAGKNPASVSIHQDQRRLHGVKIELDAVVIRVSENASQPHDKRLAVGVQCDLVRSGAVQLKGIHPLILHVAVVHRDDAFSGFIAVNRGVQKSAVC